MEPGDTSPGSPTPHATPVPAQNVDPPRASLRGVLYALLVGAAVIVIVCSLLQSRDWEEMARRQTLAGRAALLKSPHGDNAPKSRLGWVKRAFTGGKQALTGQLLKDPQIQRISERLEVYGWIVRLASLLFIAATGSVLATAWTQRHTHAGRRLLALDMIRIAVVCLAAGVVCPVMTLVVYQPVPVLGTLVLDYKAKSILGTALSLLAGGNALLGACIVLFSVAIPLAKSAVVWHALAARQPTRALRWVRALGRWSMADVFVVAMLMTYLAMRGDPKSDVSVEAGLYYFVAYVVLSMVAAHRKGLGLVGKTVQ